MYLGSHVSFDSKEQLVKSVKEIISYGGNTFMFYTGAPQNTRRNPIDLETTKQAFLEMTKKGKIVKSVFDRYNIIKDKINDEW